MSEAHCAEENMLINVSRHEETDPCYSSFGDCFLDRQHILADLLKFLLGIAE